MAHCHDHTLQLAVGETIKVIEIMIGTPDAAFELNNLPNTHRKKIKYSLKREGASNRLREKTTPGNSDGRELSSNL